MKNDYFAGIDLGTSGCRIIIIDENKAIQYSKSIHYDAEVNQTPELWLSSVYQLLEQIPKAIKSTLKALSIDGTSGSILLVDKNGKPSSSALMYYDLRATSEAKTIKEIMPEENGGQGASGSLARLMWLLKYEPSEKHRHALHQADFILGTLANNYTLSDENNCLKLGFDVVNRCWLTAKMQQLGIHPELLPEVHPPGKAVALIDKAIAQQLSLPDSLQLISGTTDSIAAFIATGASDLGDAVTSLGSTLVVKLISDEPIYSTIYGVYSHRLGEKWLVGGASNTGGNVLRHFFSEEKMDQMTNLITPQTPTHYSYYPLLGTGERFPIADPDKEGVLTPRPADDRLFLQGMLEGIAQIEAQAYEKLTELGAPLLKSVRSVGGGSFNKPWSKIRQAQLNVDMVDVEHSEAAYGVALLAFDAYHD